MSFLKSTVITIAEEDLNIITNVIRNDGRDWAQFWDTTQANATRKTVNGFEVVARNWKTESLANTWLQFITKIATENGITLVSAEVVDYVPE
jgi:hypothetical protein